MKIKTIKQFYDLMFQTRDIRRKIVLDYLENLTISDDYTEELNEALSALKSIPREKKRYELEYQAGKTIYLDLDYEINELKKDIIFINQSQKEFFDYLDSLNSNFQTDLRRGLEFLDGTKFMNFISDRDGTVNNYCGRYNSSIQSVYNAIFLIEFAQTIKNAVILTSAPLENTGFLDVSLIPQQYFVFAGSKGREFTWKNKKYTLEIDEAKQIKLNILNKKLKELLSKPEYEIFSLIGSGLQFKFGQTTIARQDIYSSIPDDKSKKFMTKIKQLVREIDPEKKYFAIIDTNKDIEIVLKRDKGVAGFGKEFNKGDGTQFITNKLSVDLDKGENLICGDTASDLSIINYAQSRTKNNHTIFVTQKDELKEKVKKITGNCLFVNSPDALVSILYKFSNERRL